MFVLATFRKWYGYMTILTITLHLNIDLWPHFYVSHLPFFKLTPECVSSLNKALPRERELPNSRDELVLSMHNRQLYVTGSLLLCSVSLKIWGNWMLWEGHVLKEDLRQHLWATSGPSVGASVLWSLLRSGLSGRMAKLHKNSTENASGLMNLVLTGLYGGSWETDYNSMTVKHGGSSVVFWGCISASGVGDLFKSYGLYM